MSETAVSKYSLKKKAAHLRATVALQRGETYDHLDFRWRSYLANIKAKGGTVPTDRVDLLDAEIRWLQSQLEKSASKADARHQMEPAQ